MLRTDTLDLLSKKKRVKMKIKMRINGAHKDADDENIGMRAAILTVVLQTRLDTDHKTSGHEKRHPTET